MRTNTECFAKQAVLAGSAWLSQAKMEDEDCIHVAETISYAELLKSWDIGSDADEAKEGDFEEGGSSSARHVCESMILPATIIITTLSLMQSVW